MLGGHTRTGQNILSQGLLRSPEIAARREGTGPSSHVLGGFWRPTTTGRLTQGRDWASLLFKKNYLWLCRVFAAACGLSPGAVGRSPLQSRCGGFSRYRAWAPGHGPVAAVCRLRCLLACGISPPVMEPMSPALAGGFLTTGPPGKSWASLLLLNKEECWMLEKHFSF